MMVTRTVCPIRVTPVIVSVPPVSDQVTSPGDSVGFGAVEPGGAGVEADDAGVVARAASVEFDPQPGAVAGHAAAQWARVPANATGSTSRTVTPSCRSR